MGTDLMLPKKKEENPFELKKYQKDTNICVFLWVLKFKIIIT
jgi:hypothetical protein